MENIIEMKNIVKKYKGFELNVPEFNLPRGFAAALIGENGAGKTTLLDIMSGVNLDYKGDVKYFGQYSSPDEGDVRERIGYTASTSFFMPHWKIKEVSEVCSLLFEGFHRDRFDELCSSLSLSGSKDKKVSELSDGNKMRLMLASVFARDTQVLMMDEPASPLDPVMRDSLCDMIREYLAADGERSVVFSTHNISDMENVKLRFTLPDIEKLAKALDVSMDWLIDAQLDRSGKECLYLVWNEKFEGWKLYQRATSARMAFLKAYQRICVENWRHWFEPRDRAIVKLVGVPIEKAELEAKFPKRTSEDDPIFPDEN